MKKILILLAALMVIAACSDKSEPDYSLLHEKLMGYWEGNYEIYYLFYPEPGSPYGKIDNIDDYSFNEDGTYTKYRKGEIIDKGDYSVENNYLTINYSTEERCEFEILGDSLYMYFFSKKNFGMKSVYYKKY